MGPWEGDRGSPEEPMGARGPLGYREGPSLRKPESLLRSRCQLVLLWRLASLSRERPCSRSPMRALCSDRRPP